MSRQLTISSLFSTLALVTLALFARAGGNAENSDIAATHTPVIEATVQIGIDA